MFCPKCGAAEQSTDSYCKRCGEWLPDTSHLGRRRGRLKVRTPEQRNRRMRILEALSFLFSLSSVVLLIGVMSGNMDITVLALALNLCMITAAFQIINFSIGYSLQKRLKQGREEVERMEVERALDSQAVEGVPLLEQAETSHFIQPNSVTEDTTAILEHAPRLERQKER